MNLIYVGPIFRNCVSGDQKSALASDQAFGKEMRSSYGTDFAEAQGIFHNLNGHLEDIIAKGPSQTGMSGEELAARNSQALNSAASASTHMQAAIGEKRDAGGAAPGIESGVTEAIRSKAMSDVEQNLSNDQANITDENYKLGRDQYNTAVKADMELPQATMAPVTQAAGAVNDANTITDKQTNENAKSGSSWMGLVGGLADAAVGGLTGGGGFLAPKKK